VARRTTANALEPPGGTSLVTGDGQPVSARKRRIAATLLAACLFGAIAVLAKSALQEGSAPGSLVAARIGLAGLLLAPLAAPLLRRGLARRVRREMLASLLAGIALGLGALLEFHGLARLPASVLVLLLFLAPLWVALGSWLLWRRRVGWERGLFLCAAIAGIALVVGLPQGHLSLVGVIAGVLASLLYAGVILLTEIALERLAPSVIVGAIGATAAAVMAIAEPSGAVHELTDGGTAIYAVAIGVMSASALWLAVQGQRATQALAMSVILAAEPVFAVLLAWGFLGEVLTVGQLLGALAVLTGVTGMMVSVVNEGSTQCE
jgi:drug/metabolite transporter (DMT)-like permease